MFDYEQAARLTDSQLLAMREEFRALDAILEYETLRRIPVGMMTPDQMARACDLARERIAASDDPALIAALHQFIAAVDENARLRFAGREVSGRIDIGVRQIVEEVVARYMR